MAKSHDHLKNNLLQQILSGLVFSADTLYASSPIKKSALATCRRGLMGNVVY